MEDDYRKQKRSLLQSSQAQISFCKGRKAQCLVRFNSRDKCRVNCTLITRKSDSQSTNLGATKQLLLGPLWNWLTLC